MAGSEIDTLSGDAEKVLMDALETLQQRPEGFLTSARRRSLEGMARQTLKDESEKITMNISRDDLEQLKTRALQEGVSYKALIGVIIQKYLGG